jgi:hypothetical protein
MEPKTTHHTTRIQEILNEWSDSTESTGYETVSLDLGHVHANVSLTSPYTVSSTINLPNAVYTTTGATSMPWTYNPSTKITLDGPDADIEINGVSLWKTMQEIANRLNIMQTNPELETEWAELRELGEQYRALEQRILEKQATWDRLKAMPAPDLEL